MLTVHHLNQSRSKRVLWLLEELTMPYERIDHQRDATTHLAPESLKKVHPLGKAPVVVDGDITLCESSAVMEYIINLDEQQRLRPTLGSAEYYQYLEWSHFAEGSLGLPVVTNLLMKMETRAGQQPMDGYIAKEIATDFAYIETTLSQRAYFAGNHFTAADIMMTVILEIAASGGLLEGKNSTLAYLAKMQQRPAYQKAASFG
ncbi:MAG: glutathione S-transferase [Gammaproteobacteria bacterium]|jgi:glutathione S-transferase|nr:MULTISPECIES: glutathione S-transferase family protein [Thalassolituus]PHQ83863.1 MAG: glutathione S-transferase family protein [Thalassobium sp.]APR68591.1 glutathione S-transferase [Thalassolituus oleivorans]MBQ0779955.1 glutathione S-transferase family protein [Thalassolituus oleivorans]MCA6126780.1 glutathione S-transferase [Thalassolituus oleivorans 4BN06-13]PHQ84306.1 MAG: glutathione S-transferase family protein [Thalassobium sp.]|tara:strand:+ start:7500 stop:8108 length:609 start_codon:yes stop_codon:yes gene_type:complete